LGLDDTSSEEDYPVETYIKGISMGLADLVPGVSGGTIALILGIYERLILAIKSIDLKFILYAFQGIFNRDYIKKAKQNFLSVDLVFLLPLAGGIATAIFGASRIMVFFRYNYPAFINSFFFGLILISAVLVYFRIEESNLRTFLSGIFGFTFSFLYVYVFLFTGVGDVFSTHSLPMVFFSGFLAICAMILPGISGAFILIFLGQYDYMLNALQSISQKWPVVLVFLMGAGVSLLTFSRILSFMLKKYHPETLFFLTGLMIGALGLPFVNVLEAPGVPGDTFVVIGSVLSGLVGVLVLVFLERGR